MCLRYTYVVTTHDASHIITGRTVPFSGFGRGLGYPTANIRTDTQLEDGVYFGTADLNGFKEWPALIFVGTPITVGDTERRVEAHLLDIPDRDYYDQLLHLKLMHFHRANKKLTSSAELIELMKQDEVTARSWFDAAGLANKLMREDT